MTEVVRGGARGAAVDGLGLLAELERAGAISTIGLHLSDPNLPYAQFEALCVLLGKMHEAVRFAIGDAILLGEELYGEACYQALEELNVSERARWEYVRVAQKVPRSRRRKDLSWSHHRAVATLNPKEQKEWLQQAAEQRMSHHDLRDALKGVAEESNVCRCCGREI